MNQANIIEDILHTVKNYLTGLSVPEQYSMIIIIASAFLFIILERIFPYNKGQRVFREGFFDDLALYSIAQSYILGIIIFSDVPIWLQLVFFTITHDIYIYWMHRWQHKNKFLWRIHEAHHSPKKVDWLSGSRSHALEILINQTVEFLPIVLLGAPVEVVAYKAAISAVWGMYIHSNLNINSGKFQKIINGPEMHRWHHSTGKGRNRNFATKLAIWDWIFNTAYFPGYKSEEYGLKTYFPAHYIMQTFFAFRSFKRKKRELTKQEV